MYSMPLPTLGVFVDVERISTSAPHISRILVRVWFCGPFPLQSSHVASPYPHPQCDEPNKETGLMGTYSDNNN